MSERPILFSASMVNAILDGRKTQTRRVVKPQGAILTDEMARAFGVRPPQKENQPVIKCPYGKVGDRLWVRQEHYRFGHWEPVPGLRTKGNRQKWKFVADTDETRYEAPDQYRKGRHHKDPETPAWHKRLARFMPRSLSTINLEITDIRVERLQDISEEDALAEGVYEQKLIGCSLTGPISIFSVHEMPHPNCAETAVGGYRELWQSINGTNSWYQNPWVWVIEFKRVD